MPITITNIKFNTLSIDFPDKKVQGNYSLMGKGKIIAKQSFNGYNDLKIDMSKDTIMALKEFVDSLQCDIELSTGINEAVKELKWKNDVEKKGKKWK